MVLPRSDHQRQREIRREKERSGVLDLNPTPTSYEERDPAGMRGFSAGSLFLSPRPPATERDPAGVCGFMARFLFLSPRPNPDHLQQREI
jgi:hypothetical protein